MTHPGRFALGIFMLTTIGVGMLIALRDLDITNARMPFSPEWYKAVFCIAVYTAIATWLVLSK